MDAFFHDDELAMTEADRDFMSKKQNQSDEYQ